MTKHEAQVNIIIDGLQKSNFHSGDCNDRALCCLLIEYKEFLPEINHWFHKAFEKKEVTGVPGVDMAMWHLIRSNQTFWRLFEKAERKYNG